MKFIITLFIICNFRIAISQDIKAYFTQTVDNSACNFADASRAVNPEDTICAFINTAQNTLDIAVWDNGSPNIIQALNNAYSRGVQVRYISSSNSTNTALSGLNSNIPVLKRQSLTETMHNKFINIDNQKILTGSMNFGQGSMFDDYNNFVMINSVDLAQNYLLEFNEMWGSNGLQPNSTNSKFGADKTDNTLHQFTVDGSLINLYFSPSDGTTQKIVDALNTANYSVDVAMFTFINNDLGDAVIAAKNRGVAVRVIMENDAYFGSEYNELLSNGVTVKTHSGLTYDFHHKYCIIDALNAQSDPIVITGSHNWTNSAEDDYDENTLIIHNSRIAGEYYEEFTKRFSEFSTSILSRNCPHPIIITPKLNGVQINNVSNEEYQINLINSIGIIVKHLIVYPNQISFLNIEKGLLIISITNKKNQVFYEKIITE